MSCEQEKDNQCIQKLPRLLYIGDVRVESTVAGSALLYRLLQDYPVDRLCIVEGDIEISQLNNRLPNVIYRILSVGYQRLLKSRFVFLYRSYLFLTASIRSYKLNKIVNEFQPDAILTVAHGFSWITAAKVAQRYQLPLHLIIHDDWLSLFDMMPFLKGIANKCFSKIYCQADSRLCVSPYMEEHYKNKYGVQGDVLYPSRALDVPCFDSPPKMRDLNKDCPVFAYAGTINMKGYVDALLSLSEILEKIGGILIIYAPIISGLNKKNIIVRPIIPYKDLIYTLRQEVDVLFTPMTFESYWETHMKLSFPSKLADYTAAGLPILIWGPPYCSAVRWAKDNADVAEILDTQEQSLLADSVKKLTESSDYRYTLAVNALNVGLSYFSQDKIVSKFYQAIIPNISHN